MQNKGAIQLFAILLALVCLYQLSFTWVARSIDKDAAEYAAGDVVKEKNYLDSIASKEVYNLGIIQYTYRECKDREINLGLDLKGGMNVTLEVSLYDLLKALSNNSTDPEFNKALDIAKQRQSTSTKDFVTLFGEAFAEVAPGKQLSSPEIFGFTLKEKIGDKTANADVLKVLNEEAQSAINSSFDVLRSRIDKFGVTQPNIQRLQNSDRILVELPGIKEPDRARKLLQSSAKLEFWETYENGELAESFGKANEYLRSISAGATDSLSAAIDSLKTDSVLKTDAAPAADPLAALKDTAADPLAGLTSDSAKADTSRDAQFAEFAKENPLFAKLRPNIYQNEQQQYMNAPGPVVGYAAIRDTAEVNKFLAIPQVKGLFPNNAKFLWTVKAFDAEGTTLQLVAIKISSRDNKAPLEGDVIVSASQGFGQFGGKPEISMTMNNVGAAGWKKLTGANIDRSIAIVLDNYVYSFPTVNGEIAGGRSSITGNFTINEAKDLATILQAGKLPAPARIVEEAIVGPSLGAEAISNSLVSFIVAFIVILIFMGLYYMKAGWVANVALFANVFFIMGVLASLGAVLTLPGIAGIILTIGLSVDANILLFERIREEIRAGKGMRLAIDDGFKHAMSSILDSNITLLILAIVLGIFGSGPIQGFAVTLGIGIITSLFSAVLITRIILEALTANGKTVSFSNAISDKIYSGIHFDFVKNRKYYYIFSSLIILGGVIAFATKGLHYGVDFKGGRSYVVQMDKALSSDDLIKSLSQSFGDAPEVKTVGTDNRFKITTTYLITDSAKNADNMVVEKLYEGLSPLYSASPDLETFKSTNLVSSQKVGPTIANDIKTGAVWAVLISCALMFIYIFIRFKKWQYGLGATVALFHDVLIVLSFYAILNGIIPIALEIDQHFIAAILTVMGYTMTESVVVFDRIREYLGQHKTKVMDDKVVINEALNATLSRTINTTLTVFFVLVVIFIFGGEVIRGFVFALLIGRIIGTYSSLCISTPIVIDFQRNKEVEATK